MPTYLHSDPVDEFDEGFGHSISFIDYKTWDYPVLSLAALAWVSMGIKSMFEVYFGVACQAAFWFCGHSGPDAMWNALAGVQAGRGKYSYIYLPTLLTAYESIENYNKKKSVTYKTSMVLGFYGLGFLLGKYRFL